ncbi:MAG: tRNA (adenosine(37)-N6)-threonylcarbamoyltransferase complex dimerization subunit type 1 TsaB [Pseudoclavibacter sp.]|nr:tRNA (adenosine(37)-N6)-threonylcarbamoyltransferase complex dimerization subunit type 1 TsaB [Pseudoclavibacter sp.]
MLLAIDTSAGTDVAVVSMQGRLLGEFRSPDRRRHAELVGIGIAEALESAGIAAEHVTRVIAGMGPGPFTGLRVGVAAARAFAAARGIECIAMPSHDAIAHEWRSGHFDFQGDLLVTTDARRGERACSRYPAGWVIADAAPRLVRSEEVGADFLGVATRVDADGVSAVHLALAWLDRRAVGLEGEEDAIVYLRAPDATPAGAPKRVTA